MNMIAAKAVCFHRAGKPEFRAIQRQTLANARCMAQTLASRGYRIVSDGTDNHLILIDLRPRGLTGDLAEKQLEAVGLIVNRNPIPNDQQNPTTAGGLRLGTPAITVRGMKEPEVERIVAWIDAVLTNHRRKAIQDSIAREIAALCQQFPVPG